MATARQIAYPNKKIGPARQKDCSITALANCRICHVDRQLELSGAYGRGYKGSRMRETVKFAVICVSLLLAAHADAVGQRTQISALDFQERGVRLRLELERAYQDLRHTGEFKSAGNDVSSMVKKYVPVGTSFANAESHFEVPGLM